jgi:hypothetical protein
MSDEKPLEQPDPPPAAGGLAGHAAASAAGAALPPPLPPQEVHLPDGQIEHPRVRYQPGDAPLAAILAIIAAVICYGCLHYTAAWWFFREREGSEQAAKQSTLPLAMQRADRLPAEPRLEQLDRLAEIKAPDADHPQAADEALLNSFGPTDDEGFVHVPIERAIDHLIGRLPVRQSQHEDSLHSGGLVHEGDSNSGRVYRGKP